MAAKAASRSSGSAMASSSRRKPRRTAPSSPIPPSSPVGHATVKIGRWNPPPGHGLGAEAVALAQHHTCEWHRQRCAHDEHPAHVAHQRGLLGLGPDHEPRRVAQGQDGQTERLAQLHEAGRLVGVGGVDGAGQVLWVVGQEADRPPLQAGQSGDHAWRERRSQFEERSRRRPGARARARTSYDPAPVLGARRRAARPGRAQSNRARRPGSTRGSDGPPRPRPSRRRRGRRRPRWAPAPPTGPTSSGANTPSPPPSIIAGPPMPIVASGVAMMTWQQPSSAALPAKQRPDTMPTSGTRPLRAPKSAKASVSSPVTVAVSVSPGRPPPPSAKRTTGRRSRSTNAKSRSFFLWFIWPCVPASTE